MRMRLRHRPAVTVIILLAAIGVACGGSEPASTLGPKPSPASSPAIAPTPVAHSTSAPTPTGALSPNPNLVPTPTVAPVPRVAPTATATPVPVETRTPEPPATATPTPVPTETRTPEPPATATPMPMRQRPCRYPLPRPPPNPGRSPHRWDVHALTSGMSRSRRPRWTSTPFSTLGPWAPSQEATRLPRAICIFTPGFRGRNLLLLMPRGRTLLLTRSQRPPTVTLLVSTR